MVVAVVLLVGAEAVVVGDTTGASRMNAWTAVPPDKLDRPTMVPSSLMSAAPELVPPRVPRSVYGSAAPAGDGAMASSMRQVVATNESARARCLRRYVVNMVGGSLSSAVGDATGSLPDAVPDLRPLEVRRQDFRNRRHGR